jgi:hypothetical protein
MRLVEPNQRLAFAGRAILAGVHLHDFAGLVCGRLLQSVLDAIARKHVIATVGKRDRPARAREQQPKANR